MLPAFNANDFRITGGSFLRVTGGDGSAANPYGLADIYGLQGIGAAALIGMPTCQRCADLFSIPVGRLGGGRRL